MNLQAIAQAVKELSGQPNVARLPFDELRWTAEQFGTKTKFGNYNFVSTVKNRSAELMVYVGSERVRQKKLNPLQREILDQLPQTIERVLRYLKLAPFVCVERSIGDNSYFSSYCTCGARLIGKKTPTEAHLSPCTSKAWTWTSSA